MVFEGVYGALIAGFDYGLSGFWSAKKINEFFGIFRGFIEGIMVNINVIHGLISGFSGLEEMGVEVRGVEVVSRWRRRTTKQNPAWGMMEWWI